MTATGPHDNDDWNRHWAAKMPGVPLSTFGRRTVRCRQFATTRLRRPLEESGFNDVTVFRAGFSFSFSDHYRPVVIARSKWRIADVTQSKSKWVSGESGTALRFLWRNMDPLLFGPQLLAAARRSEDPAL